MLRSTSSAWRGMAEGGDVDDMAVPQSYPIPQLGTEV